MNNKKFCVYEHLFPNGKRYIGITSKKPKARWENGKGYSKERQSVVYNAIQKYGWDNIQHNILFENLTEEQAKQKEIELIEHYHTFIHDKNSMGYNMTKGGEGTLGRITKDSVKELHRQRLLGKKGKDCCNSYAVLCDEVEYGSITEFCKINNLNRGMVERWLKGEVRIPKEWLDKDLKLKDREDKRKLEPQERPFRNVLYYNNIKFKCQADLAYYLNITPSTLCLWINQEHSVPKEIYENGIYDCNHNKIELKLQKTPQKTKIEYDGKIYNSQVELANLLNIKKATLNSWLRGKNKMPKEYIKKGLKYHI